MYLGFGDLTIVDRKAALSLPMGTAFMTCLLHFPTSFLVFLALLDVLFKILENQTHAYICFFLRNQKTIYKGK
jgi:hypothetical protein